MPYIHPPYPTDLVSGLQHHEIILALGKAMQGVVMCVSYRDIEVVDVTVRERG